MREYLKFYIDGKWVEPTELKTLDVENPATEQVAGKIAMGNAADVAERGERYGGPEVNSYEDEQDNCKKIIR